jgi:hypothetical protein
MTSTDWLKLVDGGWTKPDYKAGRKFGKAFDALGSPLSDSAADLSRASYCASVRITTLYSDSEPVMGNGMVRAEIRVYWLRDGASMLDDDGICGGTELQLNTASDRYHFVYHTAGIRQQASI